MYTPLHVHSDYSILDGMAKVEDIVSKCKEYNLSACALTDHGTMGGVVSFYAECKKNNIKPIIGCEIYVCKDRFNNIKKENYHLVLLAKNNTGYKNLVKICSEGHLIGFYHKPRVDYGFLSKHCDGLICLSGCLGGHLPQALLNDDYELADKIINWSKRWFGEDYYIEIQNHDIEDETIVRNRLMFKANEHNVKIVATTDSHYVNEDDKDAHELLLAMQTKGIKGGNNVYKFDGCDYHIHSPKEMLGKFKQRHVDITNEIADKCNVELDMETNHYPVYKGDKDNETLLLELTINGANERYGNKSKEFKAKAWKRIQYELNIIKSMGFVDYFLVVSDFIRFARTQGIPVGTGRGSGAGSVIAYCTGITGICPLEYGLLFERFLNPDRVSVPDFDIDFCKTRRVEVIEYVRDKYKGVSQIGTYGTLKIKSAIKDIARTLGYSVTLGNTMSDLVIDESNTFEEELEANSEFADLYYSSYEAKEIVKYGKKLLGIKKSRGKHACGVIIADYDISDVVPTMLAKDADTGEDNECTQLDAPECESLGLLKMDFLGLNTLTICTDAISNIRETDDADFPLFDDIPFYDELAYELISKGDTDNVFQLESAGMKDICQQVKPNNLFELSDILALYRPGPMQYIPEYIDCKNGKKVEYIHPAMEEVAKDTYGLLIYQEQIMSLVQKIAGLSLAQADILRRAIGKKKEDLLIQQEEVFKNASRNNNVTREQYDKIWSDILKFAEYGFNKSHSASYATLTARTAYIKARFPAQYLGACMSNEKDMDKIKSILSECNKSGIKVCPPCINTGELNFYGKNNTIQYGLQGIKGVSKATLFPIIEERRNNGEYNSFYNFWYRCKPTKKTIIALAKAGALDSLINRSSVLENIEDIMKQTRHFNASFKRLEKRKQECEIDYSEKRNLRNQMLLQDALDIVDSLDFDIPYVKPMTTKEILKNEMEAIGCYISGHPLADFKGVYETDIIKEKEDGDSICVVANITNCDITVSKKGNKFAILNIMTLEEEFEALIFTKTLEKYEDHISIGNNIIIKGEVKKETKNSDGKVFITKIGELK